MKRITFIISFFFFQAEDGIRDYKVTGVQTCALPISVNRADLDARAVLDVDARLGDGVGHSSLPPLVSPTNSILQLHNDTLRGWGCPLRLGGQHRRGPVPERGPSGPKPRAFCAAGPFPADLL